MPVASIIHFQCPTLGMEPPLTLTDRLVFTLAQALPREMSGVYAQAPFALKKITQCHIIR